MFCNPFVQSAGVLLTLFVLMASAVPVLVSSCGDAVTVQAGDTLSHIASCCGMAVNEILRANRNITYPDLIHPGQVLRIR